MKKHTTPPTTAAKAAKIPLKVKSQQKGELSVLFTNEHYITRGVDAEIPPITQLLLWQLIRARRMEGFELDWLQVFELSEDDGVQKINHAQEQPPYQGEAVLIGPQPVTAKVYIIDDGDHSTMMLAEER